MLIYLIRNKVNNKVYIGKHKGTDLLCRWKDHQREAGAGAKSFLYSAIRKHGSGAFEVSFLSSYASSLEDLNQQEIYFIEKFRARDGNFGYNICRGGEGKTGPLTPENRAKFLAGAKANKNWLKAAEAARGVPRSPEVRAKISKARIGMKFSRETRDKLRACRLAQKDPRLGTKHSEETKRRISEKKKGCPGTFKGRKHTAEAKEKNRLAHLKRVKQTI